MATALAVRHGVFGRATLNRLKRPLATHAHREGHVIVTLSGSGGAIEADGAIGGDDTEHAAGNGVEGTTRLPLERGGAVLIDSWRPHRFVPGERASEFLTLYIAPEWFDALARSARADSPGGVIEFGAAHVSLDEAGAALADEAAAMLASGGRGVRRSPDGDALDDGGALKEPDALERILGTLVRALHARSWGLSGPWGELGDGKVGMRVDADDALKIRLRSEFPTGMIGSVPAGVKGVRRAGGASSVAASTRVASLARVASPASTEALPRSVSDFRIRRALRLMREAVATGEEVDLDRTAREAGLSRPHFFKLFRAHVGVTPGTFLNALKMEASYERLSAGRDTVTAIGLDLGFASQASFTRFFIAQSGIAPSDYRQAVAVMRAPANMGIGARNETVGYA